ncbi:protein translocase subunit SecF [Microgenomates group bacterium]|nr:protein translocase subunit SecF [Microgenomates group bacterium]
MKFRFFRYYWIYLLVSLTLIITSGVSLGINGLNLGLDFTGGSLMEIDVDEEILLSEGLLRDSLGEELAIDSIQSSGETAMIVRTETISNERKDEVLLVLREKIDERVVITRFESIGPTLGRELLQKTLIAMGIIGAGTVIYLRTQFKELKYGVLALMGVLHDIFIMTGLFSLLGRTSGVEVDSMFVTAILTTISLSMHDTVVIYDRIRELSKAGVKQKYEEVVETAIWETMRRSVNNSLMIVFMLVPLVLMGGESIHWFAVALLTGIVLGTYSSPFVCAPLLLLWEDIKKLIS